MSQACVCLETLSSSTGVCPLFSWEEHGSCDRIQSMNKGSDTALFPRRTKVAMEMKNRTIWVCVRGRNKGGIKDELGWFCFVLPQLGEW